VMILADDKDTGIIWDKTSGDDIDRYHI